MRELQNAKVMAQSARLDKLMQARAKILDIENVYVSMQDSPAILKCEQALMALDTLISWEETHGDSQNNRTV